MLATILSAFTVADIRKKLAFTALILALYRVGSYIPVPGIDINVVEDNTSFDGNSILNLLNTFSAAGLWIETTVEPRLTEEAALRYQHKQAWMNKYLGILIFKLRPRTGF